jgi:hypothetical protein
MVKNGNWRCRSGGERGDWKADGGSDAIGREEISRMGEPLVSFVPLGGIIVGLLFVIVIVGGLPPLPRSQVLNRTI